MEKLLPAHLCDLDHRSGGHGQRGERTAVTVKKGFWVVRVSVKNAENYPRYLEAARPAFEKYGAQFMIRGGRYVAKEGVVRERNVVVEFSDFDTAVACYHSPEYQAAMAIRLANAEADFVIVEGA